MKALVLENSKIGLSYKNHDLPKSDNPIIKLLYSSINHRDLWIIKGQYAGIKYPIILGSDGVGLYNDKRVLINPGQYWGSNQIVQGKNFKILGLPDNGTFADYVNVPKEFIYEVPKHLTDQEAAALPLAGLTAYRALFTKGNAKKGEKLLISGIGGGVALFVLKFATAIGMEVYVTSGSKDKINKAIQHGAISGVNYKKTEWEKSIKTDSGGFNLIIDSAGGAEFNNFFKIIKPGGRIVFYGGTQGNIQNISPQIVFWKQISILGTTMGSDLDFKNMLDFVSNHKIKPVLDSLYKIEDFEIAFKRMEKGFQFGKIILKN